MRDKPELDIHATAGVAVINPALLGEAEMVFDRRFDFMEDLVPYLIERGERVYGYLYDGPWFDIESLERYKKIDFSKVSEILAIPLEEEIIDLQLNAHTSLDLHAWDSISFIYA